MRKIHLPTPFETAQRSDMSSQALTSIRFSVGRGGGDEVTLAVLDQLALPRQTIFLPVTGVDDGYNVIKKMNVRGTWWSYAYVLDVSIP